MARRVKMAVCILTAACLVGAVKFSVNAGPAMYQMNVSLPDGNNGYYKTWPEVVLTHMDGAYRTRYQVLFPSGKKVSGSLEKKGEKKVLSTGSFEEGANQLDVWMEEMSGGVLEGTEQTKVLQIDMTGPEKAIRFTQNGDRKTRVELVAEDRVSGVEGIYYRIGNGNMQYLKGGHVYVTVPAAFSGKIYAYAVDKAGNAGSVWESGEIRTSAAGGSAAGGSAAGGSAAGGSTAGGSAAGAGAAGEGTESESAGSGVSSEADEPEDDKADGNENRQIGLHLDLGEAQKNKISGKDVTYLCKMTGSGEADYTFGGEIFWEQVSGRTSSETVEEGTKAGADYLYKGEFNEEGIFTLCFWAEDQQGNRWEEKEKILIDKTDPVILKLGELDGSEREWFQWDYEMDQVISDFSYYTYTVRLDGILCHEKQIYRRKGMHTLDVCVTDAAGNTTNISVQFRIT